MTEQQVALQILCAIISREGAADPHADYSKNGTDCNTYDKIIAADIKRAYDYAKKFV